MKAPKIGVFDSGVGGLTVLRELRARSPGARYHYLGDTANVPYGTKSPGVVQSLCRQAAERLRNQNVDMLVVACNTASSVALETLAEEMGKVPVVGVVEPGVTAVLGALRAPDTGPVGPILVLATRATVKSGLYGRMLRERLGDFGAIAPPVTEQACPLLVPLIEEGWTAHGVTVQVVREYVGPHAKGSIPGVALLACTHYPWIQHTIEGALPGWRVINSAHAVADAVEKHLGGPIKGKGSLELEFTDPDAVPEFARKVIATGAQ